MNLPETPPDTVTVRSDDGSRADTVIASGGMSWTRVRTPRWIARIAKAIFVVAGCLSILGAVRGLEFDAFALLGLALNWLMAFPLIIGSYILSLTQTSFAGSLEIHDDHLALQTTRKRIVIAREKILSALVVERSVFMQLIPTVEIELVNGDILVARLQDSGSARAVIEALGFGTGGARVHASLAKPTRRLLHPLFGLACYCAAALSGELLNDWTGSALGYNLSAAAIPLVGLALYALLRRVSRPPEITVGDDGVLVKHRLRARFIPRRDIAFVSAAAGTALVIETHEGKRLRVGGLLVDDARRSSIARVIEERTGPAAAGADRFAHYARGGRALPEWRGHLAHAMNETTYRANAATVDEAAAVLRSAEATPEQRVGAALALRVAGQPKERIRVAVEGAVDPDVREALEAVAESEDDGAIEKALRRLVRAG